MTIDSALRDLNNTVLDLQSSEYNTYVRFFRRLAQILISDDLKSITDDLKTKVDFEAFIAAANPGGIMVGSASLNWPTDSEQVLGLSLTIIERGAADPKWLNNFTQQYYYARKPIDLIRNLVKSVIIPFNRDFSIYVTETLKPVNSQHDIPTDAQRVFIVHGHDEGLKETVARLVENIGLEPVILHEQTNQGLTILEKFEKHSNVGYAIVLLTPDDIGRSKSETKCNDRARQNVILELGYFLGKLGRDRVTALRQGDIEIPSDYMGVLYINCDANGAWRTKLARELKPSITPSI